MKGKKTGGRQKGTPNKPKALKIVMQEHSTSYYTQPLSDGRTQFQQDLDELTPSERIQAEIKLLNKTVPDVKAVDASITHSVHATIEERLSQLCAEESEDDDA